MAHEISLTSIIEVSKTQISTDALGDQIVVLDIDAGIYYNIIESGVSIWKLIMEPRSATEIVDAITEEYDVARTLCEQDVITYLQQLLELGLIDVHG